MRIVRSLGICGDLSISCWTVVAILQLILMRLFCTASLMTKLPVFERQLLALQRHSSLLLLTAVSCMCFRLLPLTT